VTAQAVCFCKLLKVDDMFNFGNMSLKMEDLSLGQYVLKVNLLGSKASDSFPEILHTA
jgi:hypothetical protein